MHSACIKIHVGIKYPPLIFNVVKNVENTLDIKNPPLGFYVIYLALDG